MQNLYRMMQLKKKADIEILNSNDHNFLANTFIPQKIIQGSYQWFFFFFFFFWWKNCVCFVLFVLFGMNISRFFFSKGMYCYFFINAGKGEGINVWKKICRNLIVKINQKLPEKLIFKNDKTKSNPLSSFFLEWKEGMEGASKQLFQKFF